MKESKLPYNINGKPWWQESLTMFTKLSGWVLVPLVVGTTLGHWLDARNQSGSKWFFICIGIAFVISTYGMIRQARSEYAKITPPLKTEKTQEKDLHERNSNDN